MHASTAPARSPLQEMVATTPTALWNDSCSVAELEYALAHGAVGATSNPVIVGEVLAREWPRWKDRVAALVAESPDAGEDAIAWRLIGEMSATAATLLEPVFAREQGRNGRLSIQTDPRLWRDARALVAHAVELDRIAPNVIVKIPATRAGIAAIEAATERGISVNATVCFTLPQCIAVAEAVERGLRARERRGEDIARMGPVCTIMVGRLDDWLKVVTDRAGLVTTPGLCEWAGVAVMKKAYRLFRARGYRLRLLSAAFRNHLHWSEFIGGDVVISPPHAWQKRYNASDIVVKPRMDDPVDAAIVAELERKFPDFRAAYAEDGLAVAAFDAYPPTVRTLRQFLAAYAGVAGVVRDAMLPDPEARR